MAIRKIILIFFACVTLSGCIYSNTVVPYSTRFDKTPVGSKSFVLDRYRLTEPISGYNMYVEWTDELILKEAKKAGISNIYYMDKKTLSILNDTFKREKLIVYGE